jgi:hypothetical protein
MLKITLSAFAAALLALSLIPNAVQAQTRVFVAAQGSDSNPCTFASPCRTFQHAHDVLAANGEIDVLDPAGYGSVLITKSISIQGHGYAGISVSQAGTGINVNSATATVSINGLLVDGGFVSANGIRLTAGKSLTIENCVIRNSSGDGIFVVGNVAASATTAFTLSNTIVADNGGNGIEIQTTGSGTLNVSLNRVEMYNNGAHGLAATTFFVDATATDSVAAHNGLSGFSITNHAHLHLNRTASLYNKGSGIVMDTASIDLIGTGSWGNGASSLVCTSAGGINSYADNVLSDGVIPGPCGISTFPKF